MIKVKLFLLNLVFLALLMPSNLSAQRVLTGSQISIDYTNPQEYTIGGISVSGVDFMDHNIVVMISELNVGDKILVPGEEITKAIENIWRQQLFTDVSINITSIQENQVFLDIELQERPRISRFEIIGARRSDKSKIEDKLNITRGDVVTDNLLVRTRNIIENYYIDNGYLSPEITLNQEKDTIRANNVILNIDVDRGPRTRIDEVIIIGNEEITDRQIKRLMKNTRERSLRFIFSASKLVKEEFKEDRQNIIDRYNEIGKRDAVILKDTFYFVEENRVVIELHIEEGPTYYFRDINWVGNTVYNDEVLGKVLNIQKGDIYNQKRLEKNLFMNMDDIDISSLYLDNGYLFFNITPVEVNVSNDSIDLELRIFEGTQAEINRVTVSGNDRTNDHVILREVRTRPGMLFSRSDIIRSQREIIALGYFDQEKIDIIPRPNPTDGTVDLEYVVAETSSDQIELSGGWGYGRIIGTLGLTFNNFSTRNILNKEAWRPLPTGDGQKLTLRAQTQGRDYISYSASFMEPWLGGKKPNALTVSMFHNKFSQMYPNKGYFSNQGVTVGLAQRLRVPDDFFFLRQSVGFHRYDVSNPPAMVQFIFNEGVSNNLFLKLELGRNSTDAQLYPRSGSNVLLGVQATPPYSTFSNEDFSRPDITNREKFRLLEYHKWTFNTSWYSSLAGNLVFSARTRMGFLGFYNEDIGVSPFERYYLGGDGLTGWSFVGKDVISMRGYTNESLTPRNSAGRAIGGNVYNKFTAELRFPISLNPMATIYALTFAEAGNSWSGIENYNPFELHRSAGVGVRIFLPMFGLLGLDWGYGFDEIPGIPDAHQGNFHFSIGQSID